MLDKEMGKPSRSIARYGGQREQEPSARQRTSGQREQNQCRAQKMDGARGGLCVLAQIIGPEIGVAANGIAHRRDDSMPVLPGQPGPFILQAIRGANRMEKDRLSAFSDGVIAIIITIMVLDLKVPQGTDWNALHALWPVFASYVMSFVYVAIYWHNHHHLLHTLVQVDGLILWANSHLLFWLSLVPFATGWMGEHYLAPMPTALYGLSLFMPAIAYYLLQLAIIRRQGQDSILARALGADYKGKLSPFVYFSAIGAAFVQPWISIGLFTLMALIWLVPDKRIERALLENNRD